MAVTKVKPRCWTSRTIRCVPWVESERRAVGFWPHLDGRRSVSTSVLRLLWVLAANSSQLDSFQRPALC